MNLIDYLKRRRIDRRVKSFKSSSEYKSWDRIKTVMVLFESNYMEQNDDIRQFIWRIQDEGKRVSACMFADVKESPTMSRDSFVVLDRKSIDFWGEYKSDAAKSAVMNERYDLVLDLTSEVVVPLMYFMLDVDAGMRCGMVKRELSVTPYDMQIEMERPDFGDDEEARERYNDKLAIAEQVIRYLKMIR